MFLSFYILIFIILFAVINITYHKPDYFQKSVSFCSLDGDIVDVEIDIQWHKYFLKRTELHGKIIFGETEYLSRRDKYNRAIENNSNLFKNISDKINKRRDGLHFYHSELQYPFPDHIWGIFDTETNIYLLHYSPVYSKSKEAKRYYGPATTKEEAYEIASQYFGFNNRKSD